MIVLWLLFLIMQDYLLVSNHNTVNLPVTYFIFTISGELLLMTIFY